VDETIFKYATESKIHGVRGIVQFAGQDGIEYILVKLFCDTFISFDTAKSAVSDSKKNTSAGVQFAGKFILRGQAAPSEVVIQFRIVDVVCPAEIVTGAYTIKFCKRLTYMIPN